MRWIYEHEHGNDSLKNNVHRLEYVYRRCYHYILITKKYFLAPFSNYRDINYTLHLANYRIGVT